MRSPALALAVLAVLAAGGCDLVFQLDDRELGAAPDAQATPADAAPILDSLPISFEAPRVTSVAADPSPAIARTATTIAATVEGDAGREISLVFETSPADIGRFDPATTTTTIAQATAIVSTQYFAPETFQLVSLRVRATYTGEVVENQGFTLLRVDESVGHPELALGQGSVFSVPIGGLIAMRVDPRAAAFARTLNVTGAGTGKAIMAVYSNRGNRPDALLAASEPFELAPGGATHNIAIDVPGLLRNRVWIALLAENGMLLVTSGAPNSDGRLPRVVDQGFGNGMPAAFPNDGDSVDTDLAMFLTVGI